MLGLSLPSAVLRFLTRLCTRGGSYEYKVCPFHNATQRELAESWNSFYGILGYGTVGCAPVDMCVRHVGLSVAAACRIWGEWIVEEDDYSAMLFTDGTSCSPDLQRSIRVRGTQRTHVGCDHARRDRRAGWCCRQVNLECGEAGLSAVDEPSTCVYVATLQIPEVCDASMGAPEAVVEFLASRSKEEEMAAGAEDAGSAGEGAAAPEGTSGDHTAGEEAVGVESPVEVQEAEVPAAEGSATATTEATSVPDGAGVGGSTSADGGGDDLAAIRMELTRIRAMATSFLQATTGEGGQDFAQDVLAAVTAIDGHVQTLEEARA